MQINFTGNTSTEVSKKLLNFPLGKWVLFFPKNIKGILLISAHNLLKIFYYIFRTKLVEV